MGLIRDLFVPRTRADTVSDLRNPSLWLLNASSGRRTASGEVVTPDSAMALSAYYASLRNVSEDLSKLPLELYRRRATRGSDVADDHALRDVLRWRPNPLMPSMQFRMAMQHRAMAWGNAYAEIVRAANGDILELWPIHPARVEPVPIKDGRDVEYRVQTGTSTITLPRDVMFHVRGMGDGYRGYSVIQLAAESLGVALAAQKYGAAFFGEDGAKRIVAVVPEALSPEGRKGLRKRIRGDQDENPIGSRQIPILEGDIRFETLGIPPQDAQFLETRQFSVEDVARWFRMALAKLQTQERAQGWSTLEALNTDYVNDALGGWAVAWEQEVWAKLLSEDERETLYAKHVFQALLRGDYATRTAGYSTLFNIGVLSPNDIRDLEDMNPIEDPSGDEYYAQGAVVPLKQLAEEPEEPEPAPMPPQFGGPPVPEDDDEEDAEPDPDEDEEGDEDEGEDAADAFALHAEALEATFSDAAARVTSKAWHMLCRAARKNSENEVAWAAWAGPFWDAQINEAYLAFDPARRALLCLARTAGLPDRAAEATAALNAAANEWARAGRSSSVAHLTSDPAPRAAALAESVKSRLIDAIGGRRA